MDTLVKERNDTLIRVLCSRPRWWPIRVSAYGYHNGGIQIFTLIVGPYEWGARITLERTGRWPRWRRYSHPQGF